MMEKQILIVVAGADLAVTTIGRVVIVLYAVILMIAAALLLWKTISAVYRNNRHGAHGTNSASSANSMNSTNSSSAHSKRSSHNIISTIHFPHKSRQGGGGT